MPATRTAPVNETVIGSNVADNDALSLTVPMPVNANTPNVIDAFAEFSTEAFDTSDKLPSVESNAAFVDDDALADNVSASNTFDNDASMSTPAFALT